MLTGIESAVWAFGSRAPLPCLTGPIRCLLRGMTSVNTRLKFGRSYFSWGWQIALFCYLSRIPCPWLKAQGTCRKIVQFIGCNFEFFLVKSNSGWVERKVQEEVDSCHVDEIRRSKCLWWTRENSVGVSSSLCFSIVSSLFSFFNLKHFFSYVYIIWRKGTGNLLPVGYSSLV